MVIKPAEQAAPMAHSMQWIPRKVNRVHVMASPGTTMSGTVAPERQALKTVVGQRARHHAWPQGDHGMDTMDTMATGNIDMLGDGGAFFGYHAGMAKTVVEAGGRWRRGDQHQTRMTRRWSSRFRVQIRCR